LTPLFAWSRCCVPSAREFYLPPAPRAARPGLLPPPPPDPLPLPPLDPLPPLPLDPLSPPDPLPPPDSLPPPPPPVQPARPVAPTTPTAPAARRNVRREVFTSSVADPSPSTFFAILYPVFRTALIYRSGMYVYY